MISDASMDKKTKLSTALSMFQAGEVSIGYACEFAGVDLYTFMEACQQHEIDVINHDPDEVEADLLRLTQNGETGQTTSQNIDARKNLIQKATDNVFKKRESLYRRLAQACDETI